MRRRSLGIIALCATALAAQKAMAASGCNLGLSVTNQSFMWNLSFPTQQLQLTVTKQSSQSCDYVVTFSKGASSSYNRTMTNGATTLSYDVYKDSALTNVLKQPPDVTTVNDVLNGSFGSGTSQSQNQTYYLNIPTNLATTPALKPAGTYVDTLTLQAFEGDVGSLNASPDATASINYTTTIPRIIQLSLIPTGGAFNSNSTVQTLNFGTLTQGASLGFDLRVLSNAGYLVTFSSQNNGVLVNSNSSITTTVPYTITVNGATVNLSSSAGSPVTVATANVQTTTQGALNPVAVTIGSTAGAMSGSYSDYITVTTTTTE